MTDPTPVAELVAVKPLEWEDWSSQHRTNVTALTGFGRYAVIQLHFPEMHYKIDPPNGKPFSASTLDAAKAAAQADYEARILSALTPASAEPVAGDLSHGWLIHKAGRGWYRPNAQGYTSSTAEAGRYSHEDALSYSHPNGWDGPRDEITIKHESEIAHPALSGEKS